MSPRTTGADAEAYRDAARARHGRDSVGPWSTVQPVDGGAFVDVTVFVPDAALGPAPSATGLLAAQVALTEAVRYVAPETLAADLQAGFEMVLVFYNRGPNDPPGNSRVLMCPECHGTPGVGHAVHCRRRRA